jgi:hypothetical protein
MEAGYFSIATWPVLYTTVNSLEKRSFLSL